jgi:hypothetical protein
VVQPVKGFQLNMFHIAPLNQISLQHQTAFISQDIERNVELILTLNIIWNKKALKISAVSEAPIIAGSTTRKQEL